MTIHLIASSNAAYANRITAWLDAAQAYAPWHVCLACVLSDGEDGAWHDRIFVDYPQAMPFIVSREALPFLPPLDHLQAGGFLEPWIQDDDVVVFTDGDAYMQRPPTEAEQQMLEAWPAGVVGLSYNDGPEDTLGTEASRLKPQGDLDDFDLTLPIFNLGVIVARAGTYRRWLARYVAIQPQIDARFAHHARQQWGLCAVLERVQVLPATFHAHGHYPAPPGVTLGRERGRITANGEVVLFRHHL